MNRNIMEHEMVRFATMTEKQQYTRINRMTKVEKLRCYIKITAQHKCWALHDAAVNRLVILHS